jgi:hypothetical protein
MQERASNLEEISEYPWRKERVTLEKKLEEQVTCAKEQVTLREVWVILRKERVTRLK